MYGLTAFSPLPSIEIGRMTTSLSLSVSVTLCTEGFSRWQVGHQVAQNRTTTTLSFRADASNPLPCRPGSENAGIGVAGLTAASPIGGSGVSPVAVPSVNPSTRTRLARDNQVSRPSWHRTFISPPNVPSHAD